MTEPIGTLILPTKLLMRHPFLQIKCLDGGVKRNDPPYNSYINFFVGKHARSSPKILKILWFRPNEMSRHKHPLSSTRFSSLPITGCSNGKVYNSCGSACPLTCANYEYRDRIACIEICVGDCFCPEGLVEYNGGCLNPRDCPANSSKSRSRVNFSHANFIVFACMVLCMQS